MTEKYNWIKNHNKQMGLLGRINGTYDSIFLLQKQKEKYEKSLQKYKKEEKEEEQNERRKKNE